MEFFDNSVFTLNSEMVLNDVDTSFAKITVIDNFYDQFDKVCVEYKKLPVTKTDYNNDDMLDGRLSYAENMIGTLLPFLNSYCHKLVDIIGYGGNGIGHTQQLLINVNQAITDKYRDNYYNIHHDANYPNHVATVVFMNEHYESGEGFNLYKTMERGFNLWTPKDNVQLLHFVEAKPNRAVVFSTDLNHGAAFNTKQFESEPRYTQVIFTLLK